MRLGHPDRGLVTQVALLGGGIGSFHMSLLHDDPARGAVLGLVFGLALGFVIGLLFIVLERRFGS